MESHIWKPSLIYHLPTFLIMVYISVLDNIHGIVSRVNDIQILQNFDVENSYITATCPTPILALHFEKEPAKYKNV